MSNPFRDAPTTPEKMIKMFFYGLFRMDQMGDLLIRKGAKHIGYTTVPGYSLRITEGGGGVFAVPRPNGNIYGDLMYVPEDLLPWLDQVEGHPDNYLRTEVTLSERAYYPKLRGTCQIYVMPHDVSSFTVPLSKHFDAPNHELWDTYSRP